MELWYPPKDRPHLLEWWRPVILASRAARQARLHWLIHLDEMVLVGRVDRSSRPAIWVYRHESGGELYLDATGQAYRYTRTPKAKSHGRFTACEIDTALWAAGLHHAIEPVWHEDPSRWGHHSGVVASQAHEAELDDDDADGEPEPTPRRRGHLTVLEGGAHPKAG